MYWNEWKWQLQTLHDKGSILGQNLHQILHIMNNILKCMQEKLQKNHLIFSGRFLWFLNFGCSCDMRGRGKQKGKNFRPCLFIKNSFLFSNCLFLEHIYLKVFVCCWALKLYLKKLKKKMENIPNPTVCFCVFKT